MNESEAMAQLPVWQLRQLAGQGDERAIAALLNQALVHKQVTVQVELVESDLDVLLSAVEGINYNAVMVLIDRELLRWRSPFIQMVRVRPQIDQPQGMEQPTWCEEFMPGAYAQPRIKPLASATVSPRLQPRSLDSSGRNALIAGLVLAWLCFVSPLRLLLNGFQVLVHEVGHAVTHWAFGRPAIPTVNLLYGGGVTLTFGQSALLLGLIYLAIAFLLYLLRSYPWLQGILFGLTGLYSLCLLTPFNLILSISMGHGMEVIAVFVCLYLAASGYFCRFSGDRSILAMLGFFALFSDIEFAWKLSHDLEFRSWYEGGIGGVLDNDLVILARDYFLVDLSAIANVLLWCTLLAPLLAFALLRYHPWVQSGWVKLIETRRF